MLVGALEHDHLKAILPLSPAIVIVDGAKQGNMLGGAFDPDNIPDEIHMPNGRILGGNYFRAAQMLPVDEAIRLYERPVLIVHGDEDESVPVKYAYEAAEKYKNCTLKIIQGDTHCYDHHLDEVCAVIGEFLKEMQAK